ncbi:MAG: PAS domain-containing sensor histidine kinase [Opitutales bacterium]
MITPAMSHFDDRVLVLAPTGRDAELSCAFLGEAGVKALACRDMDELTRKMGEGCAAVILAEEALDRESVLDLIEHVSRQPSWSEIPLCAVTSGGQVSADALRQLIAARAAGNVTVLERPFRSAVLVNAVQVAVAARRRQYQVRDLLRERETILNSINDAFVRLDKEWRYTYVNARAAEFAQARIDEMMGRTLWEIYPSLSGTEVEDTLRRAAAGDKLVTLEYLHASTGRWFHQRVYPSPPGVSIFTADLTGRKKIETELAEVQEELGMYAKSLEELVQERTATLEETNAQLEAFCYTIAHDLRAPLRAQQGFASILLEDYGQRLDRTGRDHLERIAAAAGRLDLLVTDLLSYARFSRTEMNLDAVNLKELIGEVCNEMEFELSKGILHQGLLDFNVLAHEISLKAAVSNLLSNALKFTDLNMTPTILVEAEERNEWIRLWVKDNGIGIAPGNCDQIFRVFYSLHKAGRYPGTGVGLAIVRKAVERMGGRVGVESVEGVGSDFWIDLRRGPANR